MRIVANTPTALTIRLPKVAPQPARATTPYPAALPAPPPACPTRYGTPDAGFVMQLIATATQDDAAQPALHMVDTAYGSVGHATQPPQPGNRISRSI